jgi:hypothetical protein
MDLTIHLLILVARSSEHRDLDVRPQAQSALRERRKDSLRRREGLTGGHRDGAAGLVQLLLLDNLSQVIAENLVAILGAAYSKAGKPAGSLIDSEGTEKVTR